MNVAEAHRYKVGDIEVTVVPDGFRMVPLDNYIINASKEEINAALAAAGFPPDQVKNTYCPIVVTTAGKRVLFDTGVGEGQVAPSKGERGTLNGNLAVAGIDRTSIDVVVISHFHADHVNGLLDAANKPAFPKAEIKVPEVEWKFWMDDGEMSRASKGRMSELFQNNRRVFDALARKVTPYAWNKEVAPGVTAVGTPGHSIGHTSYVVSSGGDSVYVQSDVTNVPYLFAAHPGWRAFFDQDPPQAEATRRRVYDMLVADKMKVQGFHHPFPGLGRVEKHGDGYRVVGMNSLR
jgi:glyoxylase-like metal-dependent hydrolase (beta-lactamase superfamily II)